MVGARQGPFGLMQEPRGRNMDGTPPKAASKAASQPTGTKAVQARSTPQSFGFKLRRLQLGYNRLFVRLAPKDTIPTSQLGALALVCRNPGITPGELAAMLTMDAAQLTPVLKQLENRSHIRREKSLTDSRSHSLHPTSKGTQEYARLQDVIAQADAVFVEEALGKDGKQQLYALLDRLDAARRARELAGAG